MRFRLHGDEAGTVHKGMLQTDGTVSRADHDAGTAVIALTGIHDDGVLPFHRSREEHITLADGCTAVAADAEGAVVADGAGTAGNGRYSW